MGFVTLENQQRVGTPPGALWTRTQCGIVSAYPLVCSRNRILRLGFSSMPPGGTTRQMGLVDGSSPCAGTLQATGISNFSLRCDLHEKEAGVVCRQLECGTALQWSRAHHGINGHQEQKYLTCQGTETNILHCLINVNFLEQCDLLTYTQVVCTGRNTHAEYFSLHIVYTDTKKRACDICSVVVAIEPLPQIRS